MLLSREPSRGRGSPHPHHTSHLGSEARTAARGAGRGSPASAQVLTGRCSGAGWAPGRRARPGDSALPCGAGHPRRGHSRASCITGLPSAQAVPACEAAAPAGGAQLRARGRRERGPGRPCARRAHGFPACSPPRLPGRRAGRPPRCGPCRGAGPAPARACLAPDLEGRARQGPAESRRPPLPTRAAAVPGARVPALICGRTRAACSALQDAPVPRPWSSLVRRARRPEGQASQKLPAQWDRPRGPGGPRSSLSRAGCL